MDAIRHPSSSRSSDNGHAQYHDREWYYQQHPEADPQSPRYVPKVVTLSDMTGTFAVEQGGRVTPPPDASHADSTAQALQREQDTLLYTDLADTLPCLNDQIQSLKNLATMAGANRATDGVGHVVSLPSDNPLGAQVDLKFHPEVRQDPAALPQGIDQLASSWGSSAKTWTSRAGQPYKPCSLNLETTPEGNQSYKFSTVAATGEMAQMTLDVDASKHSATYHVVVTKYEAPY